MDFHNRVTLQKLKHNIAHNHCHYPEFLHIDKTYISSGIGIGNLWGGGGGGGGQEQ